MMAICGKDKMLFDEACLKIFNFGQQIQLLGQTSECYKCDYQLISEIPKGESSILMSTVHPTNIMLRTNDLSFFQKTYLFRQQGVYGLNASGISLSEIYVIKEPDYVYTPLWIEFWTLFVIAILWAIGTFAANSQWFTRFFRPFSVLELENDLISTTNSAEEVPLVQTEFTPSTNTYRNRLKSLDTFRGITIVLMLFVNYGGGKYWFFHHASWNGLTVADVVFPWFTWIMGVSIVMSIRSQLRNGSTRTQIFLRCLVRTVALVVLGIVLNSRATNNLYKLRVPGVLQRLGISYLIVAALECIFMKPQNLYTWVGNLLIFQDVICSWAEWTLMLGLVGLHYCITMFLKIEGCPTGYLGPGGLHEHGSFTNCTGGAAGYIDRLVFGSRHLYQHPTPQSVYQTSLPYDPEGLLGTLNSIFLVFLGAQAGKILLFHSSTKGRLFRFVVWAIITGTIAGELCGWKQEGGFIPLNKNLWSLSFVLATSSMAFLLLGLLLLLIDSAMVWSGSPFQQPGKNSILLYVGSELTRDMLPWSWALFGDRTTHTEFLVMHSWGTFVWILTSIVLDKHEIYITI